METDTAYQLAFPADPSQGPQPWSCCIHNACEFELRLRRRASASGRLGDYHLTEDAYD
jgi:hypothetical protein